MALKGFEFVRGFEGVPVERQVVLKEFLQTAISEFGGVNMLLRALADERYERADALFNAELGESVFQKLVAGDLAHLAGKLEKRAAQKVITIDASGETDKTKG